jgi:hypothetical protein
LNINKIENGFTVSFYDGEDSWKENEKVYAFTTWSDAVNWLKDNGYKV